MCEGREERERRGWRGAGGGKGGGRKRGGGKGSGRRSGSEGMKKRRDRRKRKRRRGWKEGGQQLSTVFCSYCTTPIEAMLSTMCHTHSKKQLQVLIWWEQLIVVLFIKQAIDDGPKILPHFLCRYAAKIE